MEHFFLYLVLGLLGFGYLCSVMSCMFSGISGDWWEPWLTGLVLPFLVVYERRGELAGVAVSFLVIAAAFGACVLVGGLFRWFWSLV
jgi:hypothetical protein